MWPASPEGLTSPLSSQLAGRAGGGRCDWPALRRISNCRAAKPDRKAATQRRASIDYTHQARNLALQFGDFALQFAGVFKHAGMNIRLGPAHFESRNFQKIKGTLQACDIRRSAGRPREPDIRAGGWDTIASCSPLHQLSSSTEPPPRARETSARLSCVASTWYWPLA